MGEVSLFGVPPLAAPALPLDEAGKYVAGAYVVFLVLIVVYVAIMAAKLQRIERELRDLAAFAEQGKSPSDGREAEEASQDSSGTPGREAEDVPVGQPPTGSGRNLTSPRAVGGQSRGGGA